jgi:hypothetical protein
MTDALLRLGTNGLTGFIGWWADSRRRRQQDQRTQRRDAAEDLLAWIPRLRDKLVFLESSCDMEQWREVMTVAFASTHRVDEIIPDRWRHLRRSLRDAIGNGAGGIMWIDLTPSLANTPLTFHHRWTMNAIEYLDYVQSKVQAWQQAYSASTARRIDMLSYNDWLVRTERQ